MAPIKAIDALSADTTLPTVYPHADLTEEQKQQLHQVQEHVASQQLTDNEAFYLSEECLLRFLRATKWNVAAAQDRLKGMLEWRKSWKVDEWDAEYISPEQETGKQIIHGFDLNGRPLWYMRPNKQNTDVSQKQLHHMFYFMSLCEWLMPRGVEQVSLCVNFAERSSNSSIKQGREALSILQNHYPERLGQANFINMPFLVVGFLKMLMPLVDPVTRNKVHFDKTIATKAPLDHLEESYGGTVSFAEYDHPAYWLDTATSITAKANELRDKHFAEWKKQGGKVGQREWDYKSASSSAAVNAGHVCSY